MSLLLTLAIALYAVNSVVLAVLVYVYAKTALSTRAKYPVGLLLFSVLLFIHSAGTASAYLLLGNYFGPEVVPYMSAMASFEFVGVLALLRITV